MVERGSRAVNRIPSRDKPRQKQDKGDKGEFSKSVVVCLLYTDIQNVDHRELLYKVYASLTTTTRKWPSLPKPCPGLMLLLYRFPRLHRQSEINGKTLLVVYELKGRYRRKISFRNYARN